MGFQPRPEDLDYPAKLQRHREQQPDASTSGDVDAAAAEGAPLLPDGAQNGHAKVAASLVLEFHSKSYPERPCQDCSFSGVKHVMPKSVAHLLIHGNHLAKQGFK